MYYFWIDWLIDYDYYDWLNNILHFMFCGKHSLKLNKVTQIYLKNLKSILYYVFMK